jgi:hypothetical protein
VLEGWNMGDVSMDQSSQNRAVRVAPARRFAVAAALLVIAGCASDSPGEQSNAGTGGSGSTVMTPITPPAGGMIGGAAGAPQTSGEHMTPIAGTMPCAVDMVVKTGCQTCHGATPIAGAPMSLLSLADFQRDYTAKTTKQMVGQTMKMYELARIRVNREMGTTAMPQGTPLAMDAFTVLNHWLTSGAPSGTACGSSTGTAGMGGTMEKPMMTGTGGTTAPGGVPTAGTQCDQPGAFDPLVANEAENETCYNFQTHGASTPGDTSKFTIPTDESYNQFYFAIPWAPGSLQTRFGTDFDNKAVLHHWLAFSQPLDTPDGTVSPNVTGTTLLDGGAELVAGWAIGGCSTTYPKDVGLSLPDSGTLMIQWHHFNSTGSPQPDGSKVQICTVPAGSREHKAGLTFLGTETIDIAPGSPGDATTTCTNNSGGPITILGFTPHMHTIGSNMRSVINKAGGEDIEIFNKPFVFDQQINYMLSSPYVLEAGDSITTTCSWMNNTTAPVSFGQSTKAEMCYQFTVAYPYGALNNGVLSLIGATNTCW